MYLRPNHDLCRENHTAAAAAAATKCCRRRKTPGVVPCISEAPPTINKLAAINHSIAYIDLLDNHTAGKQYKVKSEERGMHERKR